MTGGEGTPAGRLWGARIAGDPDAAAWALGRSTDVDWRLWPYDIAGSRAHVRELARVGVLDAAEAATLDGALVELSGLLADGTVVPTAEDEDVHGALERWLVDRLGPLGGKVRAGRSRNDQVVSDLRLWTRDAAGAVDEAIVALQSALIDQAAARLGWTAPGYTHLQRGQPVLLSHHLLAYVWMLQRDRERLDGARTRADVSVLGSGALAGQTLGLDPSGYARDLGFAAVAENSIDAVSSRDFALELLAALAILATTVSRLAEELVVWSSSEFAFVRLGDGFTTGSSIMPQKRNPDVAELARGKAGRVIGDLVGLLTTVKGLPLAYDRDLQEDKEPVFDAVDTMLLVLPALAGAVASAEFDHGRLEAAAAGGFSLATDVAEALVRRGVPFRVAHEAVGALVREAERLGVGLGEVPVETLRTIHPALDRAAIGSPDPSVAVARRDAPNGTALPAVSAQLERARVAASGRPRGSGGSV